MYVFVFLLVLLLLFFASQLLTRTISQLFFTVFRSQNVSIRLLAFLMLPGVIIHEIAHALMAYILFVPVGKMEFLPVADGDHVKLGSVQVGKSDPVRRMLIGVSPVIVGLALLAVLIYFFLPRDIPSITSHLWRSVGLIYGLFVISNTMFSSRKDLEGTLEILAVVVILGVVFYFVGVRLPAGVIEAIMSDQTQRLFQQASLFLSVPLGIDILVILLVRMLFRNS